MGVLILENIRKELTKKEKQLIKALLKFTKATKKEQAMYAALIILGGSCIADGVPLLDAIMDFIKDKWKEFGYTAASIAIITQFKNTAEYLKYKADNTKNLKIRNCAAYILKVYRKIILAYNKLWEWADSTSESAFLERIISESMLEATFFEVFNEKIKTKKLLF